jgi:hypothetical protein
LRNFHAHGICFDTKGGGAVILVIGGYASGKREYVKQEYGYDDCDMADGVLNGKPVLFNLQDLVASQLYAIDELLEPLLKKPVVVCNEVGCASSRLCG